MNYLLIFSHAATAAASLFLIILHIIKRRKFTINRVFILLTSALLVQYSLMIVIDILPGLASESDLIRILIFIPVLIFTLMFLVSFLYPLERMRKNIIPLAISFAIVAADIALILFMSGDLSFEQFMGVPKTDLTAIQLGIVVLLMAADPLILLLKISRHSMNRIRNTAVFYIGGVLFSYMLFISIYFGGHFLYGLTLMQNPFVAIPVIYLLVCTSYLLIDLRNNDFPKFYRESTMIFISFAVYATPVYFFLINANRFSFTPITAIIIKSSVIFMWLVIAYRILSPVREFILYRNINRLKDEVNNILVPVHELRKITDMDKFWSFITKDNFQGLQNGFGIQSAYFMLISRKDRGYNFTYGFGPGIDPDFLSRDSSIVKQLSSYSGVFEKSYLLTDIHLAGAEQDINEFFTRNNLEGAIPFRNLSDVVVGFLFLGSRAGKKGFNADMISALEIFRIKLQNLLTTGLILDEVTADQVNDHDRIVVNTVKKRITPDEMISIPGVRISSFNINNSSSGGDYIDSVKVGKDSSIIFISDTSYSGIDSALIALQQYSILHSRTMIFNSAEKVLNTMNQVLKTSRISGSFVKSACVIISSDGNFTYSSASFNPLIIYDSETGKAGEVETSGIPLGIEMDYRYTMTSAKLREGSIGVLCSDGLITASDGSGETFTSDRIKDIVVKFARQNPSIIIREIYREFNRLTGTSEQLNDISVIVFKKVKIADE